MNAHDEASGYDMAMIVRERYEVMRKYDDFAAQRRSIALLQDNGRYER